MGYTGEIGSDAVSVGDGIEGGVGGGGGGYRVQWWR